MISLRASSAVNSHGSNSFLYSREVFLQSLSEVVYIEDEYFLVDYPLDVIYYERNSYTLIPNVLFSKT